MSNSLESERAMNFQSQFTLRALLKPCLIGTYYPCIGLNIAYYVCFTYIDQQCVSFLFAAANRSLY